MTKGNPIVPVRIGPEWLAKIGDAIERKKLFQTVHMDYTISEFIRACVKEHFDHLARGQRSNRNRRQKKQPCPLEPVTSSPREGG